MMTAWEIKSAAPMAVVMFVLLQNIKLNQVIVLQLICTMSGFVKVSAAQTVTAKENGSAAVMDVGVSVVRQSEKRVPVVLLS